MEHADSNLVISNSFLFQAQNHYPLDLPSSHLELPLFRIIFYFSWMFEIATRVQLYFNFLSSLLFKHVNFPWLKIKFPDFSLTDTWHVATLKIQNPYYITLVLTHMVKTVSSNISMSITKLVPTKSLSTRWAVIKLVCGFLWFVFFC